MPFYKLIQIVKMGRLSDFTLTGSLIFISTLIEVLLVTSASALFGQSQPVFLGYRLVPNENYVGYWFLAILVSRTLITLAANYSLYRFSLKYLHYIPYVISRRLFNGAEPRDQATTKVHTLYAEANTLVNNLVHPIFVLLKDLVTVGATVVFVAFAYTTEFSVVIAFFLILFVPAMVFITKQLKALGPRRQQHDKERLQHISDVANAHVEFNYSCRDDNIILKSLRPAGINYYNVVSLYMFLRSSNRYVIEFIVFLLLIYFVIFDGVSSPDFIAVLAIIAMRAVPALSSVVSFANTYRYCMPALNKVYSYLVLPINSNPSDSNHHTASRACKSVRSYQVRLTGKVSASRFDHNLSFEEPTLLAITGPSGAGKSTILRALAGAETPLDVDLSTNGQKISKTELFNIVAYCSQDPYIVASTVTENIRLLTPHEDVGSHAFLNLMTQLAIPPELLNRGVVSPELLSGGQKKKIGIARAILLKRWINIFDEPTSELDETSAEKIRSKIRDMGRAKIVVVATHDSKLIEIADREICVK